MATLQGWETAFLGEEAYPLKLQEWAQMFMLLT